MPLTGASNEAQFLFEINGKEQRVMSLQIEEALSALFVIELTVVTKQQISFDDSLGQKAKVTVLGHKVDRYWHGVVSKIALVGARGRFFIYHVQVRPAVWMLTHEQDYRIFQNKNTQEIIETVFSDSGIAASEYDFQNQSPGATREYCVQYGESDFNFISRLLEEEGIFYFFKHDKDKTVMVFGDGKSAYQPIPGDAHVSFNPSLGMVAEHEVIREISFSRDVCSGKVTLQDFNFEKPALSLLAEEKDKTFDNLEVYEYPGLYTDQSAGKKVAQVRLQEALSFKDCCLGSSSCPRLIPGGTFSMKSDEKLSEFKQEYLLARVVHVGEQPQVLEELADQKKGNSYENRFEGIPSAVIFRPARKTMKPIVNGMQTAMVVGPAGEEIFTDKYGRIKVQFHWDRKGKKDDKSSCWIRVSQTFTGASWGAMTVPRIGQEMLVGFINGDPDRPIITGRVYHGNNPVPYELPSEKTKTTFKSNSSLGGGGFNELRYEDKKGQEEVFLHAQKDWNTVVLNNRDTKVKANQSATIDVDKTTDVGANHTETIGANQEINVGVDQNITIGSNKVEQIGANCSESVGIAKDVSIGAAYQITVGAAMNETIGAIKAIEVGANLNESVGGSKTVNVSGDSSETVSKNKSTKVAKDSAESVDGIKKVSVKKDFETKAKKIIIEAEKELTIKVGKAIISMKDNGDIAINGKKISVEGSGDVVLKGKKVLNN